MVRSPGRPPCAALAARRRPPRRPHGASPPPTISSPPSLPPPGRRCLGAPLGIVVGLWPSASPVTDQKACRKASRGKGGGGGGTTCGSRPTTKHHRRPRPSSLLAPTSRRAERTVTTSPESKGATALQDPVVSSIEETSFTFEFKRGFKRAKKTMLPEESHRGKDDSTKVRTTALSTCALLQEISFLAELPSLKDVFEVTEMENKETCIGLQSGNEELCPRSDKDDLEFVRQKFLDAKLLSTDEAHRNSKEFSEALEILYSKKDAFLEILQENSGALPAS